MNHLAFKLNSAFLDELYERINALREQYTNDKGVTSLFANSALISRGQLEKVIDTAYWASHVTEERHQIKLSLVLREYEQSSNIFHFDRSISLNSKNLVKLGSALESSFSDICIWPDKRGQFKIWGLRMRSTHNLTTDLWIQVLGPGNILIICYGRSIAALIRNQAVFVDPTNLFATIVPKICSINENHTFDPTQYLRLNTLLYIAQAMRAHERGGILLVIPEGSDWKKSIGQPLGYTGEANFLDPEATSLQQPSHEITANDLFSLFQEIAISKNKDLTKTRMQLIDQCNRIGRLTAVDGALVMNFDRSVHCFGATILPINCKLDPIEVRAMRPVEGDSGTKIMFGDLGGTRHYSAAQFAYDQPDSIAIVASQDGHVTFFSKDSSTGELLVVQQAELALMYEGIGGAMWNLSQFIDREI